jgi:hypothetical protein
MVMWEPGETLICAICQGERGGADPPGPWFRRRPGDVRRIPIFQRTPLLPLGYMEYRRL